MLPSAGGTYIEKLNRSLDRSRARDNRPRRCLLLQPQQWQTSSRLPEAACFYTRGRPPLSEAVQPPLSWLLLGGRVLSLPVAGGAQHSRGRVVRVKCLATDFPLLLVMQWQFSSKLAPTNPSPTPRDTGWIGGTGMYSYSFDLQTN
jgi:hypothetical protein